MLFVIRFTDKANTRAMREQNLAAYITWLGERRDSILVPGSLREEQDSNPIGAFWIVEAASKSEAAEMF